MWCTYQHQKKWKQNPYGVTISLNSWNYEPLLVIFAPWCSLENPIRSCTLLDFSVDLHHAITSCVCACSDNFLVLLLPNCKIDLHVASVFWIFVSFYLLVVPQNDMFEAAWEFSWPMWSFNRSHNFESLRKDHCYDKALGNFVMLADRVVKGWTVRWNLRYKYVTYILRIQLS